MDAGVVIIDIGGEHTNLSVFCDGAIQHTATVALGGRT